MIKARHVYRQILKETEPMNKKISPVPTRISKGILASSSFTIKKDIPALRLSDAKLWWKEKTYKTFGKLSCALTNKEYEEIIETCQNAIELTKIEMDTFKNESAEVKDFLNLLKESWKDGFER